MRTAVFPALLLILAMALPAPALAGKAFDTGDVTGRQLIDYLDHPDWRFRHDSCEEIGDRKLVQAEEQLIPLAIEDDNERVRRVCLEALKRIGSGKIVPAAETMLLDDPDAGNRKYAIGLVEDLGNDKSGAVLAQVILSDSEAGLRKKAVVIARKKGWVDAVDAMTKAAVEDADEGVREEAREALADMGGEGFRKVLYRILLEDPDVGARRDVVEMLEDKPRKEDRDTLIRALDDADTHVARIAARALVKIGDRTVAPILREKALDATDSKVAEELNEAAERLGG
jgi:HEAT repeat protein